MIKTSGGFLITQIKQIQSRVFDSILRKYGVEEFNGAQGRILYVLWQEDNLPIIELSHRTSLAKTTLTSMLDRMEQHDIIKRTYNQKDRRQIKIILTEKSIALRAKYDEVSKLMNLLFYKDFTETEIITFENFLERIFINLREGESNE